MDSTDADVSISKAKLHETFDVLPNLIDVLKDVLSASSTQETMRIGDVSASAVSVKHKYAEALELLRSLPGTDTSLEEQETAIADARAELKRISDVVELYSNTLYRGTDEPRAEINDAFSRKSLLK
ncbi:60S ribosomal protein L19-1 [Phytophthora cinnamomi]|uniref:60S ribosomal protein L19-1 n=1 Tax=Phytophthora cinnamomi TaxID=4785 RepID=UPI0035597835|nr:60S ribosomal protein L19-1 [Phytophthora cinnamomi]